jgi:hypothetical protein
MRKETNIEEMMKIVELDKFHKTLDSDFLALTLLCVTK